MSLASLFRGRGQLHITNIEIEHEPPSADPNGTIEASSSRLSLRERNEKEVDDHGDRVTAGAQLGVQKAEAVTLVWSRTAVYLTYAWIWVGFFMLALQQSVLQTVSYLAYSEFYAAPQISQAYILSSVIGGVVNLPIAKALNLWGRAEGFFCFVVVYLLGMIILAASNSPNSYAAGYTIYWIGYDSIYFIMDVFIADTSGLRNRAFAFAFASTPFICTAFTGPLAAQALLRMTTWRWAIGLFCIVQFFVYMPLVVVFKYFQMRAAKKNLFVRQPSGRTTRQSILHYFHEFDIIGALLLLAAFVMFLLPFSMATYGYAGYSSATFIALVVAGFVLFFVFVAWEAYFARAQFVRWELFRKPTVLGACMLAAVVYFSFYAWDQYYYYFVMVVYDLDIAKTGYMSQIYNIGSCLASVVFGVYIHVFRHFKWACLLFGLPLMLLGAGLMIHFRGDNQPIGYLAMCQIFIAIGGGVLVIGEDMAVMAAADRDGVPMMLALIYIFAKMGGAVGYAVCAAIYTNTFPQALRSALPPDSNANVTAIYLGGYVTQLEYPVGSATRAAINYAWGDSQKYECIAATAILVLGIPAILMWRNYNVDRRQNKGILI